MPIPQLAEAPARSDRARLTRRAALLALATLLACTTASAHAQPAPAATQEEPFTIERVEPPATAPPRPPASAPAAPPKLLSGPAPSGPRLQLHDSEDVPRDAWSDRQKEWYGWQTLGADLSSIALMIVGVDTESTGIAAVGLGGFLLATPAIHGVHGNSWGWPSFGMRAGSFVSLSVGTALAVSCISFGEETSCGGRADVAAGLLILGLGGAAAAIVLDAVFARSKPSAPDLPSLALWGDPSAGNAGFSLTMVH